MAITQQAVESFFKLFETNSNSRDISAETSLFANVFLAAGPGGGSVVRVEDFRKVLPVRRRMLETAGLIRTSFEGFEITAATDRHAVANATWRMHFRSALIPVSATFMIDLAEAPPKILVYLAHQDIMRILKDRSLLRT